MILLLLPYGLKVAAIAPIKQAGSFQRHSGLGTVWSPLTFSQLIFYCHMEQNCSKYVKEAYASLLLSRLVPQIGRAHV